MNKIISFLLLLLSTVSVAQDLPAVLQDYRFEPIKKLLVSEVKNQHRSGTCWIYSAHSFFESELLRMGKGNFDLSEMFIARAGYLDRAVNYVRRQGAAAFGQGAETHDVLNLIRRYGLVPQSVYSGFPSGQDKPVHGEMEAVLKAMADAAVKLPDGRLSPQWRLAFEGALNGYMGAPPAQFSLGGKEYTPQSYFQSLGINLDDYIALTSYTHHPFYQPFVLEVSDNWSNGLFYNIPIDEMVEAADYAIDRGYSIVWASDVSEKTFAAKEGLAIWPIKPWDEMTTAQRDSLWKVPGKEKLVTQEERQQMFDELSTTDDHGMHITGMVKDQMGTRYYTVKNSWGVSGKKEMSGYLFVSQPYFRAKTMSMLVHKNGVPPALRQKLGK